MFIRAHGGWSTWTFDIIMRAYVFLSREEMGKLSRQCIDITGSTRNLIIPTSTANSTVSGKKKVNINRTHNLYARENRDRINAQRRQNYAIRRCLEKV